MRIPVSRERGSVLVTVIIMTALVSMVVVALLYVVQRQNYFTARSTTWNSEIPIAEAGIEEAMAHLNTRAKWGTSGWQSNGPVYYKSRAVGTNLGYFYTTISTSRPPTITSIGYGRLPGTTNYSQRTVMVLTKENPPIYGVLSSGHIKMGGATFIDSYDSTDPNQSTGGLYDSSKRSDQAGVATLSTVAPSIIGGKIYGYAATGPGGSTTSTVGDGAWIATGSGVQPGHFQDDWNASTPTVTQPAWVTDGSASAFPSVSGVLSGTKNYVYYGNFGRQLTVVGTCKLYITGDVKMTGTDKITISSGGSLELYLGGTSATFGGGGVINLSGTAANLTVYGMPSLKIMDFKGNSSLTARLVAPYTDVDFNGTSDIFGSIIAKTIDLSGSSAVHYDEALGVANGAAYAIVKWEEL